MQSKWKTLSQKIFPSRVEMLKTFETSIMLKNTVPVLFQACGRYLRSLTIKIKEIPSCGRGTSVHWTAQRAKGRFINSLPLRGRRVRARKKGGWSISPVYCLIETDCVINDRDAGESQSPEIFPCIKCKKGKIDKVVKSYNIN